MVIFIINLSFWLIHHNLNFFVTSTEVNKTSLQLIAMFDLVEVLALIVSISAFFQIQVLVLYQFEKSNIFASLPVAKRNTGLLVTSYCAPVKQGHVLTIKSS